MCDWGYKKHNGPAKWGEWFPVAEAGTRQSPIDLGDSDAEDEDSLPPLIPKYSPVSNLIMENTGASWKVNCSPDDSSLTGGPLSGEYKLLQMHAHWGSKQGKGSEHTLNGKMFDGELHLVHYNTGYGGPDEAVDKPDGLAVLGVFLQVGEEEHVEFEKIIKHFHTILCKGDSTTIQDHLDPAKLLPDMDKYYTYPGSLTTPPLFESVTWMVFNNPITISRSQVKRMRRLLEGTQPRVKEVKEEEDSSDDGLDSEDETNSVCMINNYRPVCGKLERVVKKVKV